MCSCDQPVIKTSARKDRFLLGLYLALQYLLASIIVTSIHEVGHLAATWLIGGDIYGIYISPFIGKVFTFFPEPSGTGQALESLAGIMATQVTGYTLALISLRERSRSLFCKTFFTALIVAFLINDSGYLWLGSLFRFGDPYYAAVNFGVSPLWMFPIGVTLFWINCRILRRPVGKWFSTFCPQRTLKEHVGIFRAFAIWLVVICVPYYGLCFLFIKGL